jgi:hypothetical protein
MTRRSTLASSILPSAVDRRRPPPPAHGSETWNAGLGQHPARILPVLPVATTTKRCSRCDGLPSTFASACVLHPMRFRRPHGPIPASGRSRTTGADEPVVAGSRLETGLPALGGQTGALRNGGHVIVPPGRDGSSCEALRSRSSPDRALRHLPDGRSVRCTKPDLQRRGSGEDDAKG